MSRSSLIVAATILSACNGVLGLDERPARVLGGEGATTSTAVGGSGGAPGCMGAECFPRAPDGWTGPILFAQGSVGEAAACTGDYATEELFGFTELVDPTHSCPCECSAPSGIACTISVIGWDNPDCTSISQTRTFDGVGDCKTFSQDPRGASFPPPVVNASGATCVASVAPQDIPAIAWAQEGRACGPVDELDGLPSGFDACVYQSGDIPCPDGSYSTRTVVFDDVDDTRACDVDCSCGAVVDAGCDPIIESHRNFSCSEEAKLTPAEPGCVDGFFDSALLVSVTPTGTCPPGEATASGMATPTGATTVCCES